MKDQLESWEFEDPRESWWKWQHQYAQAADRISALEAERDRLREALRAMFEAVCGETGFAQAVRAESGIPYPWPALDRAEAMARAALEASDGVH